MQGSPAQTLRTLALCLLIALPAGAETLHIGAASSLRDVVRTWIERFASEHPDHEVVASYGASSTLAAQLRAGAPLHVLLLADSEIGAALARELDLPPARAFARNRLVILTRDAQIRVDGPRDLGSEAVRRIAIPSAAVPIGRYAREWLARADLLDRVEERSVRTEHARATLMAVDHGHVDLAIVYETDARLARHAVVSYRIPDDAQPAIEYVALLGPRPSKLAEDWLRFIATQPAREALASAGFGLP